MKLWEVIGGKLIGSWEFHEQISCFLPASAFAPGGELVSLRVEEPGVSGAEPFRYWKEGEPLVCRFRHLRDGSSGEPIAEIKDFNWRVNEVACSDDGKYFAIDGLSGTRGECRILKVFDNAGKERCSILLKGTGRYYSGLSFNSADTEVGASLDGTFEEFGWFDVASGNLIKREHRKKLATADHLPEEAVIEETTTQKGMIEEMEWGMRDETCRFIAWSRRDGTVCVADCREVDRRLRELGVKLELYTGMYEPAEAIEVSDKVLQKEPDNFDTLRREAYALRTLGRHAEAISIYEKALEIRPDDSGVLNNLAWVLATSPKDDLRDGKRAIKLATKAAEETDYKTGYILSTLAAAYAETGDFETARKWSAQAVEEGREEDIEVLKKELRAYKKEIPWRELIGPDGKNTVEPKVD